jgi:hypothetical protein
MRYASEDKTCQEEWKRTVLISLSLRIKYKVYALNYPAPYLRSTLPFSPLHSNQSNLREAVRYEVSKQSYRDGTERTEKH